MQVGRPGVKYGLTVPKAKQKQQAPAKKQNLFGAEDSDDDGQAGVEQQIARQAARKQTDKKVADIHAAALAEDPSIFDYDAHYDDIQASRAEPKRQEKVARHSKYIASLLEKAEERKREQSILMERQLAKERAAEDHLYGDKERFVTSAYRKKLAEDAKWLEEEKRKKEQEEKEAVEKKGHMGDFYRNLLRSNVAFGAKPSDKPKQQQQAQQAQQPAEHEGAAGPAGRAAPSGEPPADVEPEWEPREADAAGPPAGWEAACAARDSRAGGGSSAPGSAAAAAGGGDEEGPLPPHKHARHEGGGRARATEAAAQGGDAKLAVQEEQQQGEQQQQQQQQQGPPAAAAEAGQRRNREDAVAAARERYLARKRKAGQE